MAEKRASRTSRSHTAERSAERRATEARKRAEQDRAAMDNPEVEDEPSEIRHAVYFTAILVFALLLNLVVLIAVSGGQ